MPGIHIDRFIAGLHTNRAAISTPFRSSFGHIIEYRDALIDGLNVEISPANTLVRRPGWTKYCTATYGADVPNAIAGCSLPNATGTGNLLHALLSTNIAVYDVTPSALTSLFTKNTTNQTFFQQVGIYEFFSDGVNNMKWDGNNTPTNNGVVAPPNAPTVPNLNLFDTVNHVQTVHAWSPNASYFNSTASPQTYYIIAPTGELYQMAVPAGSTLTSQSSAPNWGSQFGIAGGVVTDGTVKWSNSGTPAAWVKNTVYGNSSFSTNGQVKSVSSTGSLATTGSAAFAWQIGSQSVGFAPTTGTTGNSNTLTFTNLGLSVPAGATIDGITVGVNRASNRNPAITDTTVQLLKAGVATGSNKAQPGYWPQVIPNFYQIPTSGGVFTQYGNNYDLWGAAWAPADITNVGFGVQFVVDVTSTRTTTGSYVFPITITVYYHVASVPGVTFSTIVLDSNGNYQQVQTGGTSGGAAPAWSKTIGGTVVDGGVTWQCLGTANQLPPLFSWTYASGFHTNSNHISTMSPTLQLVAPIIGNNVNLQGNGSNDTQVDRNDIYRTPDGGSILLFDQSAPNVNASTAWTINDNLLDSSLNALLIGPVAHANDPPPAGMTIIKYHMGRLWGIVGNLLYFSGGPDTTNGDGMQAWPPANVFTLDAPGTGLIATTQGLLVCTGIDISVVLGGPQTNTFWLQPLMSNIGVETPNCITQDSDVIILYTSQQQFMQISASSGRDEIGFVVAPTLAANFGAGTGYIAVHRAGQDQGIFISDNSGHQMRFNMNATAWDPIGAPVNGIGPLASISTAVGTRRLLSTAGGFVVFRDVNTYSDAGSAYAAFAVIGSIVLSQGGEKTAALTTFVIQSPNVGNLLAVAVLPNEISGSFTNIPFTINDPYNIPASSSINMNRYDWKGVQSMLPDVLRHIQIKVTMPPTDTVKNEIYTVSLV